MPRLVCTLVLFAGSRANLSIHPLERSLNGLDTPSSRVSAKINASKVNMLCNDFGGKHPKCVRVATAINETLVADKNM